MDVTGPNENATEPDMRTDSRLNQQPVFVNGFSRGGTTILMNLLASHPELATVGEVHQVFKGSKHLDSPLQVLAKALLRDAPVLLSVRQDLFSPRLVQDRRQPSVITQRFIDRVLYRAKMASRDRRLNAERSPGVPYTRAELRQTRLLGKNLDGMIHMTDVFQKMYSQAHFVGLVRNGLALCEGHLRRGRSAKESGQRYNLLVRKMLDDARRSPRYEICRFEQILQVPLKTLRRLLVQLGLNPFSVSHLRIQARRYMNAEGKHTLSAGREWDVEWIEVDQVEKHLESDVNQHQLKRLSRADRLAFLRVAGDTMEELGYLPPATRRRQAA